IISHYATLRIIKKVKIDIFPIKKALFSRLLRIPLDIQLSKTRGEAIGIQNSEFRIQNKLGMCLCSQYKDIHAAKKKCLQSF
ncbi:MAG: hypothetical protein M1609_11530, partial [Firmicutes bacterium]|nr:hypothetical protein [Bacillota bacterium]MCL5056693.1 hypothetical protein [Actinomycetota bacterium]